MNQETIVLAKKMIKDLGFEGFIAHCESKINDKHRLLLSETNPRSHQFLLDDIQFYKDLIVKAETWEHSS